jgi:hypothetical protein
VGGGLGGTIEIGEDGQGSVTITLDDGALGRSAVGFDEAGIATYAFINYYQFILVDDLARTSIWKFDDVFKGTGKNTLYAPVNVGHNYHFLLLGGYKETGTDKAPTLLASGYYQQLIPQATAAGCM